MRATIRERLTPPGFEADYDNGFDGYFGNQCADTQYPSTFGGFVTIDRYAQAGSEFGPLLVVVQQRLHRLAGQ